MHSCAVLGNEPPAVGSIAYRIPGLRVKPMEGDHPGLVLGSFVAALQLRLPGWLGAAGWRGRGRAHGLRHDATIGKSMKK